MEYTVNRELEGVKPFLTTTAGVDLLSINQPGGCYPSPQAPHEMVQLPVHPAQRADIFEAQYRREDDFLHHFTRKAKQCQEPLLTCMTRHDGECTVSFPGQEAGLRKWDMHIHV